MEEPTDVQMGDECHRSQFIQVRMSQINETG